MNTHKKVIKYSLFLYKKVPIRGKDCNGFQDSLSLILIHQSLPLTTLSLLKTMQISIPEEIRIW